MKKHERWMMKGKSLWKGAGSGMEIHLCRKGYHVPECGKKCAGGVAWAEPLIETSLTCDRCKRILAELQQFELLEIEGEAHLKPGNKVRVQMMAGQAKTVNRYIVNTMPRKQLLAAVKRAGLGGRKVEIIIQLHD